MWRDGAPCALLVPQELRSAVHYAATKGALDAIRWLASKGVDIDEPDAVRGVLARHSGSHMLVRVRLH